jgi:hypothetical protein
MRGRKCFHGAKPSAKPCRQALGRGSGCVTRQSLASRMLNGMLARQIAWSKKLDNPRDSGQISQQ